MAVWKRRAGRCECGPRGLRNGLERIASILCSIYRALCVRTCVVNGSHPTLETPWRNDLNERKSYLLTLFDRKLFGPYESIRPNSCIQPRYHQNDNYR